MLKRYGTAAALGVVGAALGYYQMSPGSGEKAAQAPSSAAAKKLSPDDDWGSSDASTGKTVQEAGAEASKRLAPLSSPNASLGGPKSAAPSSSKAAASDKTPDGESAGGGSGSALTSSFAPSNAAAPETSEPPGDAAPADAAPPDSRLGAPGSFGASFADRSTAPAAAPASALPESAVPESAVPESAVPESQPVGPALAGVEPEEAPAIQVVPHRSAPAPQPLVSSRSGPAIGAGSKIKAQGADSSTAAADKKPAKASDADAEPPPFEMVTVFYGTDRAVIATGGNFWLQPIVILAVILMLITLLVAWLLVSIKRWVGGLVMFMTGGAAATSMMLIAAMHADVPRGTLRPGQKAIGYGPERGALQFGTCAVSIPRSHQVGELEAPSILRLEVRANPDEHVVLHEVLPQADQEFFDAVRARVQQSPRRDLFVFVHGYNVTFDLAARRTAQIAYDLKFQGAPVFYSWPSQGQTWNYTIDETNVAWTVPHLKQFLLNLGTRCDAQAINLIAHSMGNRALTQAIRELAYELRTDQRLFHQVVLAAPDIDADLFERDIAPAIAQLASQVTLYASANDEALLASKLVHGYPRAGDADGRPLVVPGIETIDVSTVDMSILGHSYYGTSEQILKDLGTLFYESRPASNRPWLRPIEDGYETYWAYDMAASTAIRPQAGAQW